MHYNCINFFCLVVVTLVILKLHAKLLTPTVNIRNILILYDNISITDKHVLYVNCGLFLKLEYKIRQRHKFVSCYSSILKSIPHWLALFLWC